MSNRSRHFNDRPNRVRVIDDERKQALMLQEFKLVPPEVGIFDAPYKCYTINDEWAKIVMGLVSWLADIAVWRDPPYEDNHPGILEILKFLSQDGNCSMFQLRQSPDNNCLLEQSLDGGVTWSTAFDYSLCNDNLAFDALLNEVIALRRSIEDLYDGTIASVAPNVVGDGSDYDDIRALALCDVVLYMVRSFCEAELTKRELADGLDDLLQAVTDILLGMVGSVFKIDVTPLSELISRLIFQGLGAYWSGLSESTLSNDEARQNVACCMISNMDVVGFDREQWRNSADGCGFGIGSDEELIATGIQDFLDLDDVWVLFLQLYENSLKDAEDGYVDCPCEETWEETFDFTIDQQGWGVFGSGQGIYIAGVGFRSVQDNNETRNYIAYDGLGAYNVTEFVVNGSWAGDGSPDYHSFSAVYNDGSGNLIARNERTNTNTPNTDTLIADVDVPSGAQLRFFVYASGFTPISNPSIFTMTSLTIRGNGTNPFS